MENFCFAKVFLPNFETFNAKCAGSGLFEKFTRNKIFRGFPKFKCIFNVNFKALESGV